MITNTAFVIFGDAAVVLCVAVGDVCTATDTGKLVVCTNVPAHVVTKRTFHVVVTGDLTLGSGGIGGTVFGTLVVTSF